MLPIDLRDLKALIVDVDGTLYRQRPVRRVMLWRLLRAHAWRPALGIRTLRVLRAYRRAHEALRTMPAGTPDLADRQVQLACDWTGLSPAMVGACVTRWFEREPLDLVGRAVRDGVPECLQAARDRNVRLGVLSDYPAGEKLAAMGIAHFFDVTVSAQDDAVRELKPSPRGLEVVLQSLAVECHRALYVGDRPEVDAAAAARAGVPCVIIGRRTNAHADRWVGLSSYIELRDAITR